MTVGSLMIAAVIIGTVFRLLIGSHMVEGLFSSEVHRIDRKNALAARKERKDYNAPRNRG